MNVYTYNGTTYTVTVVGSGTLNPATTNSTIWVSPQNTNITIPVVTVDEEQRKIDAYDHAMKVIG